ncbi:MAG TPA: glycosyltransferase [Sphingomonadaceae bacterium]|nr:glycosyltransferase [Sphingomonadaceae bacterium]
MAAPLRILHFHSTFAPGGKELRAARLMNAWGPRATHTVVSGMPGELGAQAAVDVQIKLHFPLDAPPLTGKPALARYEALARFMIGHDLVLTYNWGAMDAVLARRMHAKDCPPLIHHEDGFNEDEAGGLKRERGWFRRLALPGAHRLVVPSALLEGIALKSWKQPRARVQRIANGIDVARFARPPKRGALPGFSPRKGALIVGTIAGLRRVKNLPRLVEAFATLPPTAGLAIVGDGPERPAIREAAARHGVVDRVHVAGFVPNPATYVGLFDIFALSSDSEQAPISVIEAMAAGLPVAAPAVGDIANMVAPENRRFIVAPGDTAALGEALRTLAADPVLRKTVGEANRARARAEFEEREMIAAYAALYSQAAGRPGALTD